MAGLDREAIYGALKTRLDTLVAGSTLKSVTRRLPPATPPGPLEQPCAFVPCGKEVPRFDPPNPYVWTLHLVVLVYAQTDDATQAPSSILAPIVKAIEAALQWAPGDSFSEPGTPTSLGGLCAHVAIVDVEYGEGVLDGQGVAMVHLEILAVER